MDIILCNKHFCWIYCKPYLKSRLQNIWKHRPTYAAICSHAEICCIYLLTFATRLVILVCHLFDRPYNANVSCCIDWHNSTMNITLPSITATPLEKSAMSMNALLGACKAHRTSSGDEMICTTIWGCESAVIVCLCIFPAANYRSVMITFISGK